MRRHSNHNALVPTSGGVQGNRPSQQQPEEQGDSEPVVHTFKIDKYYFRFQEDYFFYPNSNYEVVKVQATDRDADNAPLAGNFQIINFPIDRLNEHLVAEAIQLSNIRMITMHDPLLWNQFLLNRPRIREMALRILIHVQPTLTRIVICADILNDKLFDALGSLLSLRELEISLGNKSFDFINRKARIGEDLDRGIARLHQVECLKIPLELVTGALLSRLGRLPSLRFLKTTGSINVPFPGRFFIDCTNSFAIQTPRFFGSLQILDVRGDLPEEDFISRAILSNIFPNTKFIKT